tara:strand:- start:2340 stop:2792 length:453 start_codon:yes stop_codon:yes gene_type:complete
MQGSPPPQQDLGSVWDQEVPQQQTFEQQPSQQQAYGNNAQIFGNPTYNIPMGGAQMYVFPKTSASTALGLSIAGLALGFMCFPLCGLLAVPGFFMSQASLNITNSMPNHPDSGTAKTAQIVSLITLGLMLVAAALFVLFIALELNGSSGF